MKVVLKDNPDPREISGAYFFQANLILSKLDEIITHNKVTTNQSTSEREEQVLHIVEDRVSSKDDIMIILKEERDDDYCGEIGEGRNPFLLYMTEASIIQDRTTNN